MEAAERSRTIVETDKGSSQGSSKMAFDSLGTLTSSGSKKEAIPGFIPSFNKNVNRSNHSSLKVAAEEFSDEINNENKHGTGPNPATTL